MLLFRGRTTRSREVREGLLRNSVSRMPFGCDCPAYVSHARPVLCPFPSLPGSARSNLLAQQQTPSSAPSSTPGSLLRFLPTRPEFLLQDKVSVLFLYLDPSSPSRTPTCSQLQSLPDRPPARVRRRRRPRTYCPCACRASERQ